MSQNPETLTLPYDIARCPGTVSSVCKDCRRKEAGHPTRQNTITPDPNALLKNTCYNKIPKETT